MNTAHLDQPREDSGQWASHQRSPAGALENGPMASFIFPPRFHDAEEHLRFFMQEAQITDRMYSNARFAYEEYRRGQVTEQMNEYSAKYDQAVRDQETWAVQISNKLGAGNPSPDEIDRRFEAWNDELREGFKKEAPMELPITDLDPILRACQAWYRSGILPEDEVAKVDSYLITVKREQTTVADIAQKFQAGKWMKEACTDSDLRVAKSNERLSDLTYALLQAQQG